MAEYNHGTPSSIGTISQVSLPNPTGGHSLYEIHDKRAIHSAEDLGLSAALRFAGTVETEDNLPTSNVKAGDVYIVKIADTGKENVEFVYIVETNNGVETARWEELGPAHDFVGTEDFGKHTHVIPSANIAIPSTSVAGSVNAPVYTASTTYVKATAEAPTLTGSGATNVILSSADLKVSVPQITATTQSFSAEGTAATWSATVTDGLLTFNWTTNVPTKVQIDSYVPSLSVAEQDLDVTVPSTGVTAINTTWTASAPTVKMATTTTSSSGVVEVATGVISNSTTTLSLNGGTTTATTATLASYATEVPTANS